MPRRRRLPRRRPGSWPPTTSTRRAAPPWSTRPPAGNNGTIAGATRTASGRFGRALTFDGVNDWVTVPDAASLDLTGAMTLQAWVRPTSTASWRTVVFKELNGNWHSYALYATAATNVPEAVAHTTEVPGTSALPQSTWTHLAATFDGVNVRLYVNGTLVRTVARSTPMPAGSGPLRIGGNAVWNEFFKGTIDEVRLYSRALTAAEIQADRDRGV